MAVEISQGKVCQIVNCSYHLLPSKKKHRFRINSSAHLLANHSSGKDYTDGNNLVCEKCHGDINSETRRINKKRKIEDKTGDQEQVFDSSKLRKLGN